VLDQYALIDVVWNLSLRGSGAGPGTQRQALTCSSVIRQPAASGMENLVLAHQQAVSALAEAIARTASQWARETDARCPS
jgi:hypothetical protein